MTTVATAETGSGLPVNRALRLWIVAEILFGVAAVSAITVAPQDTATNFAWPIKATATAALLGAFYVAVSTIFVVALFVRLWENMRVFVPAAILFTATELLATFVHWDKFTVGTTPFYVWFASYLLPPPIFLALYVWHQRRVAPTPRPGDEPLSAPLRTAMTGLGAVLVAVAAAVFVHPPLLIAIAPLAFTPLTARAFSGWLLALGMMQLMAARENDRARSRIVSPFFILVGPAIGIQLARFPAEVEWSSPAVAVAAAVLSATFAFGVVLARGDWSRSLR